MKRSLYVSLLTIMYFSACQGSEELEQSQEKEYTVSIMARIGKQFPEHATCKIMKMPSLVLVKPMI
jgi:hypothetical protein